VRVSISTKEEFEDKRVKIGVLVVGEQAGLEKTRFFFKNPAQWAFLFFLGVFCFFWVFWFFFVLFLYICPEERVFRDFQS
jgi:hypothetical protein